MPSRGPCRPAATTPANRRRAAPSWRQSVHLRRSARNKRRRRAEESQVIFHRPKTENLHRETLALFALQSAWADQSRELPRRHAVIFVEEQAEALKCRLT